jgi:ABC-type multidrug transport system fused ATPase/permease subunit
MLSVTGQRSITEMRKRVARHVMRLPTQDFDRTKSGVLVSRIMNDAEGLRNIVGTGLVQMIGGILTASVALGALFYYNWKMTTVTLSILALFGGVMAVAFGRLRPLFRKRGEIIADVTGRLTESLGGIRTVRAYTAEKREELVFAKGAHRLFRNIAASITGVSATTASGMFIFGLVSAVIMFMGGQAYLAGTMSASDLIVYVFLIGLVAQPLVQIASIGTQITDAFAGLDRIREIMSVPTEDDRDASKATLDTLQGDIEFDQVYFEYEPDAPVLKGVSFKAPAGTTTALVGSSGSGKSTLISLVMAFNHPQRGMIKVDGRDLASLKLRSYRSYLGVVLQDNFLFDGTIAENIRFSQPGATFEEVKEVSRIAHCDEFIERFEEKYDTIVGERGVKLSGGQRQRVAIARAILANPRLLILDEATSSLDSESEAMIQDGLNALRRGRTTFVIAHRLSTIQAADQILVLEGGEIVERGNHDELLAKEGRYRELYDKQYRFERNRFINPGEEFEAEEAATS